MWKYVQKLDFLDVEAGLGVLKTFIKSERFFYFGKICPKLDFEAVLCVLKKFNKSESQLEQIFST